MTDNQANVVCGDQEMSEMLSTFSSGMFYDKDKSITNANFNFSYTSVSNLFHLTHLINTLWHYDIIYRYLQTNNYPVSQKKHSTS